MCKSGRFSASESLQIRTIFPPLLYINSTRTLKKLTQQAIKEYNHPKRADCVG